MVPEAEVLGSLLEIMGSSFAPAVAEVLGYVSRTVGSSFAVASSKVGRGLGLTN